VPLDRRQRPHLAGRAVGFLEPEGADNAFAGGHAGCLVSPAFVPCAAGVVLLGAEPSGGQLICLDLLPAIHFLPSYTTEEVVAFARKVMDMFAPLLILGISDEISQVGEIEKVEAITELVDSVCGLAG
jgi:hypothetical protein